MPNIRDLLNRLHNGPEIISAHSQINLAEILSSPSCSYSTSGVEGDEEAEAKTLFLDSLLASCFLLTIFTLEGDEESEEKRLLTASSEETSEIGRLCGSGT